MRRKARLRVVTRQPGYEGKRELVPIQVESPYVKGEFDVVVINLRESNLTLMHRRNQIDDAQFEAGSWFRKVYEQTRMGSMAIDPSREPVDTSGQADPIPDTIIAASALLRAARHEIGERSYLIVESVCGQGFSVRESQHLGRSYEDVGWRLRQALDDLAIWRGFASGKSEK